MRQLPPPPFTHTPTHFFSSLLDSSNRVCYSHQRRIHCRNSSLPPKGISLSLVVRQEGRWYNLARRVNDKETR